jgi:hypothetical protein
MEINSCQLIRKAIKETLKLNGTGFAFSMTENKRVSHGNKPDYRV